MKGSTGLDIASRNDATPVGEPVGESALYQAGEPSM